MHRWIRHVKKPWEGLESTFGQRSTLVNGQRRSTVNTGLVVLVRSGLDQLELARFHLIRFSSARLGSVRLSLVQLGESTQLQDRKFSAASVGAFGLISGWFLWRHIPLIEIFDLICYMTIYSIAHDLWYHFFGELINKTHKKTHYYISSTTLLTNYNSYFSLSTP